VRIIGGSLRGRQLVAPKGTATRPTTDRVRESLFSALTSLLGSDVGGGPVLDAFAGSGALGFEALSRGAGSVTFVENNRQALSTLTSNAERLGMSSRVKVISGSAFALASRGVIGGPFALLLLDPPYTLDPDTVTEMVDSLSGAERLSDECVLTWEHATGTKVRMPKGFRLLQTKRYGTTEIEFAIYEGGAGEE